MPRRRRPPGRATPRPARSSASAGGADVPGLRHPGRDGAFGPRTREMIAAWQRKQNQPPSGFLSAAQRQDSCVTARRRFPGMTTSRRRSSRRRKARGGSQGTGGPATAAIRRRLLRRQPRRCACCDGTAAGLPLPSPGLPRRTLVRRPRLARRPDEHLFRARCQVAREPLGTAPIAMRSRFRRQRLDHLAPQRRQQQHPRQHAWFSGGRQRPE